MPNLILKARINRQAAIAALATRKSNRSHDDLPRTKFAFDDEVTNIFV
jgi:hypothetical protein